MPGMTEANNVPWWAPGRPLIVSDPEKLTYFARANAIRAGVQSMPGSFSGVAPGEGEWADPYAAEDAAPGDSRAMTSQAFFDDPSLMSDNRVIPMVTADGNVIGAKNVETNSGGSTLDFFFNKLNQLIKPAPVLQPTSLAPPSPWPWVVGLGVAGVVLVMMTRRRA